MKAHELIQRLRHRYRNKGREQWIFMTEVRNVTGYTSAKDRYEGKRIKERYADAMVMNLWPSKGLDLHGFEVKVSRSDLQQEIRDPSKAYALKRFCDRWWLVIPDKSIMHNINVPDDWGVLCVSGDGLRAIKKAPKLEPEPISRGFLASLLRNAKHGA